ncbi:sensor histidine kinase [Lysobacter sp. TY2-98]|uniref:HAMP domain-containing sensor histidine kinase n=1 Tax=Lysobacter sp. TY2-98 TaxID=2290922 RepID=UPI000E207756|nr:HAMP domain-containing sensor histidine kinase [Lysobacter sp. TY2-98]AXK72176.1 sensor histidine kinase [Lysobacter sp. TY2-98]
MIRRLYLRIYLTTLGALATVVALFALASSVMWGRPGGPQMLRRLHSDALHLHVDGLAVIVIVALAVGLAMYPLVRALTRQIEALATSMDRFGAGDLATRASVTGSDEVAHLAASFNAMADRVASLMSAHGRMLANASHELRSPLARIRLALELHDTAPRAELLQGIRADCAEIDAQLEEILLASKLEAVGLERVDELDLAAVLAEECARLDIPFDVEHAPVRGDARLLRRMIRNLLDNALNHGQTGVDARVFVDGEGRRIVQVADRGPGIAEAERELIFEPFYRPANTRESGSGWGLGLALVRQISAEHGGAVRCLAREGGGCLFEVSLPAIRAEAVSPE